MFENIPKRWNIFSLNDLATIITGNTPPKNHSEYYETEDILWVKPSDLSEWNPWLWETEEKLSGNARKVIRILPVNSVLVSCIGTIGKIGIAPVELATNQQINSVIFNDKIINFKYGYYAFKYYKERLANLASNAVVPIINKTQFSTFKIPVPPTLEEQQEIVDVLDAASEIIRLRTACIESAQELIPALFQEMFGDLDCNNSYKKVLFGDIITVLTDYHANGSYEKLKEHVTLLDNPDYALMVRTTDLEKNNFIDNVKYISQSAYEFLEKSKIYGGEIIINKIGSAGNVYLMPKLNRPVSLGMNAFLIRIDEKCANNIFIYNLLTSSYGKKIIQEKVSGAVTKTITKNSIRSLKLYLPPVEQQELFAEKAQEIEAYIKTQQAELENAKQMFQSLLHHAFTGELTRRAYGKI